MLSFILDDECNLTRIRLLTDIEEEDEDIGSLSLEDKVLREFMLCIPYYQQLWHALCQLLQIELIQEAAHVE